MKNKKARIFCEVTCSCCGCLAQYSGWYSPKQIKLLKDETKYWITDKSGNTVCEKCQKQKEM